MIKVGMRFIKSNYIPTFQAQIAEDTKHFSWKFFKQENHVNNINIRSEEEINYLLLLSDLT